MNVDWNTILPIVASNVAMFITSYINIKDNFYIFKLT